MILTAALTAVFGLCIPAGSASADSSTCTTDQYGTITCVDQTIVQVGHAYDHESTSTTVVGDSESNVTYLVSEHLVSKAQVRKAERNGDCRWFKVIWSSGWKNGTGKMGWAKDYNVHGCFINGKWYKIGGGRTGLNCGNLLRPLKSPPPVYARVKGRVKFVDHMTWSATATVTSTADATAHVSVSVHNADFSCEASASSTATSSGTATASATATASSKVKATSAAQGQLAQQIDAVHQKASANATASAAADATAEANANASCSPSTAPPPSQIVISDIYQLNADSVLEYNQYTLCATVSDVQPSDSVTVTFAPHVGSVSPAIVSRTGPGSVCTTYTAPGEVTTDYYVVYAHDNTTSADAIPVTSDPWNVQAHT